MPESSLTVAVPSGALAVFDPETLAHRRAAPPAWSAAPPELAAEQAASTLATALISSGPSVHVRVLHAPPPPANPAPGEVASSTQRLRVTSGKVFFGDRAELPSKRWGRRRWNLWDWLFVAFLASLPLFGMWMLGFDEALVKTVVITSALFVAAMIPITWAVFRHGRDFKKRSGEPPRDFPERVVELAPGEYGVSFEQTPEALVVRISRLEP